MKKKILSLIFGGSMLAASVLAFAGCGHKHSYEVFYQVADCDDIGYTLHTCTECGHMYADEFIAPYGHAYRNEYHVKNANDPDEHGTAVSVITEKNLSLFANADEICVHKVCAFCDWGSGMEAIGLPEDKIITFQEMVGELEGATYEPIEGTEWFYWPEFHTDSSGYLYLPAFTEIVNDHIVVKTTVYEAEFDLDHDEYFSDIDKLHLIVPDNIEVIEKSAFGNCKKLERIYLSQNIKKIGSAVFLNSSIDSIIIPESLEEIGAWAFAYCKDLKAVYYLGTEEQWNAININPLMNDWLLNVPRYYYSAFRPKTEGNFWRFSNHEPKLW